MEIVVVPLIQTLLIIIDLYVWALILYIILSWLEHFGVLNSYNHVVYTIQTFLLRITEPALAPIRAILPNLGGLDISPIILILILGLIQKVLYRLIAHLV